MFIEYLKEYSKDPTKYDISNLKKGIMCKNIFYCIFNKFLLAGTLCPENLMDDVINKLNMSEITICYG